MAHSDRRRASWRVGLLLLAALVSAVGSVGLRPAPDAAAPWWPAAAFSIAAVALATPRARAVVALAVVALSAGANHLGGRSLDSAAVLGLANGAEALAGGVLLAVTLGRRGGRVGDVEDYLRLVLAALLGACTFTAAAGVGLAVTGSVTLPATVVLPSHLTASVVLLPLLLLADDGSRPQSARELALQSGALALALALWPLVGDSSVVGVLTTLLLPLPVLVWAALRARPLVAAALTAALGVAVTWLTALGSGPIAALVPVDGSDDRALAAIGSVQTYVLGLAAVTMLTAMASHQRLGLVRRLGDEQGLSATVLDTTAAMILLTEADGTVRQVNASVERLTGFSPDECVGRSLWEVPLIPPERVGIVARMFSPADGSRVVPVREADAMHVSGDRLRVVWHNNVVHDSSGRVSHVVCTAVDVTAERTSRQLVDHLFEAPMAAPMLSVDVHLEVTLLNRACEDLLGVTASRVVGRPATVLMGREAAADLEQTVAGLGGAPAARIASYLSRDWTWTRPDDGAKLTVATRVSVVRDAVGKVAGYHEVARDVTDVRASERALDRALQAERDAVERLRRLDAVKDEFVSTVSHELRTPTTSIVGYTEMLRDGSAGPLTSTQRGLLDVVVRNSERLTAVADHLLTLARLEAREPRPEPAGEVDLSAAAAAATEAVAPLLAGRSVAVDLGLPDVPVTVPGDPQEIDRVLVNLLSNAVKFTPDGGRITCRVWGEDDQAVLEVSDTGVGIPEAEQAELFTKFFRSSTAQQLAIPGTGLGLSIIRRIVEDHHGQIAVDSGAGRGTTFTVTLPVSGARSSAAGSAPGGGGQVPQPRRGQDLPDALSAG